MGYRTFRFWEKPSMWHRFAPSMESAELDYVLACQRLQGGFANWPNGVSYLETCYYALVVLGLCGQENLCSQNILDYILAHARPDGGFADNPRAKKSNIFNTFYAVVSLGMLGQLTCIQADRTLRFMMSRRRGSGGFSERNEDPASLLHTFWGVATLDVLGYASTLEKNRLVGFIDSCMATNGMYAGYPNASIGYIEYSAYAIAVRDMLGLRWHNVAQSLLRAVRDCRTPIGYASYKQAKFSYSDTFWATYIQWACSVSDIPECPTPTYASGVWGLYITLLTRLLLAPKGPLPIKYCELDFGGIPRRAAEVDVPLAEELPGKQLIELQYMGFELYKLLPLQAKQDIRAAVDQGLLIDVPNRISAIPWELVFAGGDMLQLQRPLARRNNRTACEEVLRSGRVLIVYDASLSSASCEAAALEDLFRGEGYQVASETFGCWGGDRLGEYCIIHITGHCERGKVHIRGGEVDLARILSLLESSSNAKLVFLNVCNSEESTLAAIRAASCTVVDYWGNLPGSVGGAFAEGFYENLLCGNDIAEAMRLQKTQLLNTSQKDGRAVLFYRLWGNPRLRVE